MIHLIRWKQLSLVCIGFGDFAEVMNCVDELIDIFKATMDRGVAKIGDLIDAAQFFENFCANRSRLNFATAGFQIVHDFIHELFEREQTGGTFLESFGNAAREFAAVERFVRAIALDHAQVRALDLLVSRETITAFEA
jgi:hypothetical protein